MSAQVRTALALVALMVLLPLSNAPTALSETPIRLQVAASSDLVDDGKVMLGGSAELVDIAAIRTNFFLAIAHTGAGSIGTFAWSGQPSGGLLVSIAPNGSVVHSTFVTSMPLALKTSSSAVVMVSTSVNPGVVMQHYSAQLVLLDEQTFTATDSGSGATADATYYDMATDGTDVYVVLGCPNAKIGRAHV